MAIGRMPSVYFPDQDNIHQVTFMGKDPDAIPPEDLFAAWTIAGYQTFTRNGERSYSKGLLNLYEVPAAIERCLSVLVEIYWVCSDWLVQASGDTPLRELFGQSLTPGSTGAGITTSFSEYWPLFALLGPVVSFFHGSPNCR